MTDTDRINWLQRQARMEMHRSNNVCDFLVLAEDETTCWGKTYREALDNAIRYSEAHPTFPRKES